MAIWSGKTNIMSGQDTYWAASQQHWREFRQGILTPEQYKARSLALKEQWEGDQHVKRQAIPRQASHTTDGVALLAEARANLLPREEVITRLGAALQRNLKYLAHRERRGRRTAYYETLELELEAIARAIHYL